MPKKLKTAEKQAEKLRNYNVLRKRQEDITPTQYSESKTSTTKQAQKMHVELAKLTQKNNEKGTKGQHSIAKKRERTSLKNKPGTHAINKTGFETKK